MPSTFSTLHQPCSVKDLSRIRLQKCHLCPRFKCYLCPRLHRSTPYVNVQMTGHLVNPARVTQVHGSEDNTAISKQFEQLLNGGFTHFGALRSVPSLRGFLLSRYRLGTDPSSDLASQGTPHDHADALATTLAYDTRMRRKVSELLAGITGVYIENSLVAGRLTAPVSVRDSAEVLPTNEGFGTNQLIHLLSQILLTPDGGTVLIEEPETHLHPGAQVKLAAWLATHGSEHWKQLLITTHSEHLLAGLLWQVREGKLDSLVKTRFEEVPAI